MRSKSFLNKTALLVIILFFAALFASNLSKETVHQECRGLRYGEILLGNSKEFEVYSTIRSNSCPSEIWDKLDREKIAKESKSQAVLLDGPNYLLCDSFYERDYKAAELREFDTLKVKHIATLELAPRELSSSQAYHPHSYRTGLKFLYSTGNHLHQLIDPSGNVYVMKSFKLQDSLPHADALEDLTHTLKLPTGWNYRTVCLTKDYVLQSEFGKTEVLSDDLANNYQKTNLKAGQAL